MPKVISKEDARALLEQPNVGCPTGMRNRVALELMYRAGGSRRSSSSSQVILIGSRGRLRDRKGTGGP